MKRTPPLQILLAVALPLACALGLFAEVIPNIGSRFAGIEYVDHYGTQWFYWFAEQTLLGDESAVHTDLMFYPFGKDIYGHTGANILDAYVAIPFRLLLGNVAGYNLFLILGMLAGGVAAGRFAWDLTGDWKATTLAGLLLVLSPWALYEAAEGRPTQALLALPILFLHAAWATGTRRDWRAAALAGMYLALTGYQYWFYAFFLGMAALILGIWATWRRTPGAGTWWEILSRYALAGGLAIVMAAPGALPMLLATSGTEAEIPGLLHVEIWDWRATPPLTDEGQLIGIFNWQPLRRAAGFYVTDMKGTERFLTRTTLTPWLSLVFLGLWAWKPGKLERAPILAILALCVVLATGPLILAGRSLIPNPIYIFLAKHIGFFQRLWWPGRAYVLLTLLLPFIGAVALTSLPQRFRTVAWAIACLGWTGELALQKHYPFETWNAYIPAGYRCLAGGSEGAVLELPYNFTQAHLYYQTAHGRPIFGGMLENNKVFTPKGTAELLKNNTVLIGLRDPSAFYDADFELLPEDLVEMERLGFSYVLLQKDAFLQPELREVDPRAAAAVRSRSRNNERSLRSTLGLPVYSDARVSLYTLGDALPPCDQKAWETDSEVTGKTEVDPIPKEVADLESQIVSRPFPPLEKLKLMKLSVQLGIEAGLSPDDVEIADTADTGGEEEEE